MTSSRRRRPPPPPRPVRERLDRRPRVGPPAATRSSAVRERPRGFSAGASMVSVSGAVFFVAPDPRRPRRLRERVPVLPVPARSSSGNASSRWVSGVASLGASSSAPRSAVASGPEAPAAFARVGVDPLPLPLRPRPPRLRRRLAGAAGLVSPSVAVVVTGPSCSSAFGFDRAGALVSFSVDAVDLGVDALDLGLAPADLGDEDPWAPGVSPLGRWPVDPWAGAASVSAVESVFVVVDDPPPRPPRPRPPRLRRRLGAPVPEIPVPEADSASEPGPGSDPEAPVSDGRAVVRVTAASVVTGDSWFMR